MMEYVLQTKNLKKKYRDFEALRGLDMHVPQGSIYGFVGKNGAGKTTLFRQVCGLQEPTSGEYLLYGRSSRQKDIIRSRKRKTFPSVCVRGLGSLSVWQAIRIF